MPMLGCNSKVLKARGRGRSRSSLTAVCRCGRDDSIYCESAPRRITAGLRGEWIPDREASVDDLAVLQVLRIQSGALSFECRSRN